MIERFIILHLTIKEWSLIRYKNSKEQYRSNETNNDCTVNDNDTNTNNNVNEVTVNECNDHDEGDSNDEYDDNPDTISDDELNIPILYYYNNNDGNIDCSSNNNKTTSKINFAGLCKAIYYLPQSILPMLITTSSSRNMNNATSEVSAINDRTRVVNLNNHTSLVFVPLHTTASIDNPCCSINMNDKTKIVDIIAVAQISIPNNNNTTTNTTKLSTTTTNYISQAIQQSYIQFCLLRNGTIHERLLVSSSSSISTLQNYYYPGMNQLFQYYQCQRRNGNKRKQQLQQPDDEDDDTHLLKILNSIPYTKLCYDLLHHFNDFIQELEQQQDQQQSLTTTNSKCGSTILNCYHIVPFHHHSTSTAKSEHDDHNSYRIENNIDYTRSIATKIHHHLINTTIVNSTNIQTISKISSNNITPYMIGVSIFINQQLIIPPAQQDNTHGGSHIIQFNPNNDCCTICLSNKHAVILYQYMMQIQSQMVMMTQQHVTYPDQNSNSNNNNNNNNNNNSNNTVSSNATTNTNRNKNKSNIMINNHHSNDHSSKTNLLSLSVLRPFALSLLKDDCIVSSPSSAIIPINQNTRTTVLPSSPPPSKQQQQQSDNGKNVSTATTTVPITFDKGTYMSPPPLSLLSVLDDDETNSFIYKYPDSNNEHVVWAPQITLPITTTTTITQNDVDHTTSETKIVQVRMCLYQRNNIHCLIYLSSIDDLNQSMNKLSFEGINDSSNNNNNNINDTDNADLNQDSRIYQSLLQEISNHIDAAIDDVLKESMQETQDKINKNDITEYDNELLCPNSSSSSSWEIQQSQPPLKNILKPGYDIFVIDRNLHTVFIHIDECNNDGNYKDNHQSSSPERRQQSRHQYSFNNNHNYDVRNLLTKYISSDSLLLALDNAIEDVQQYISQRNDISKIFTDEQDQHDTNQNSCSNINDRKCYYESCTLLHNHWIYSYCAKENVNSNNNDNKEMNYKELYILFHTSHYVTLSDVQQEAIQIRNAIL